MTEHIILDVVLAVTVILTLVKLGGNDLKGAGLAVGVLFAFASLGLYIWFAFLTGYWQPAAMVAVTAVIHVAADQARKNKGGK